MKKNILKNCLKKGIPTEILIVCKESEGSRYSYLGGNSQDDTEEEALKCGSCPRIRVQIICEIYHYSMGVFREQ